MTRTDSETDYDFLGVHIREKTNSSTFIVVNNDSESNYARIHNLTKFDIWVREVDPMDEKTKKMEKAMEAEAKKEKEKKEEGEESSSSNDKDKKGKDKKDKSKEKGKSQTTAAAATAATTPEKASASKQLEDTNLVC